MTTDWTQLPSFTSYFGTALHGATFKWYNNPTASGTLIQDKNELKIEFEQNLHSFIYTWYNSANVNDAKWFKGDWPMTDGVNEVSGCPTACISTPAAPSTFPKMAVTDLLMQI